jgi:type VI secretion system protein ImpG
MRDELLEYFERELSFLRRSGAEFSKRYPKIASRLLLEPNKCDDPHVERLLEGFAFLAARVHLKIDDDFSEVSEALLNVLSPHYVRPIPSLSLVQFELDPEQGKLTSGLDLPRGSLLDSRPVRGVPCRFQTCYDTTLWPVTVEEAAWVAPHQLDPPVAGGDVMGALRVVLRCLPDVTFSGMELDSLRFYLNGEDNLSSTLYELLFNSCSGVLVRPLDGGSGAQAVRWDPDAVRPVGFHESESLLPVPRRAFSGYQIIQDYFAFPQKYFFFDLAGFDRLPPDFGASAELVFLIAPFERPDRRHMLESGVSADTLRLGCTPIVNLFPQSSEPIRITHRRSEYPIIADARRRLETGVFSVDEVVAAESGAGETIRFEPFYSYRHGVDGGGERFWHARRQRSAWREDEGSEVLLSFVDLSGRAAQPDHDAATVRLTCHNGELPSQLPFGDPAGDFELESGEASVSRVLTLVKPTTIVEPPLGKPQLWRLISQLSLNYLSLVDGGPAALQEVLRVYNFGGSAAAEKEIDGILSVESRPVYSRVESDHGLSFARGRRVEIEFDEDRYAGGGVYLFASVVEHFLGLYASVNSFTQLAARTTQRETPLREWAPRAGWKPLV